MRQNMKLITMKLKGVVQQINQLENQFKGKEPEKNYSSYVKTVSLLLILTFFVNYIKFLGGSEHPPQPVDPRGDAARVRGL